MRNGKTIFLENYDCHISLLLAMEHNENLTTNTFICKYSLNVICVLNHTCHPSSQYNHPYKLLINRIIHTTNSSLHNVIIYRVIAHTNILSNEKANKLAKKVAKEACNLETPFHLDGHQTPFFTTTYMGSTYESRY